MSHARIIHFPITLIPAEEAQIISAQFYLENCIANKKYEEAVNDLIKWPIIKLIRVCQLSDEIFDFCLHNEIFINRISEELHNKNYPAIPLISKEGIFEYTFFDLFISASFLSSFMTKTTSQMDEKLSALNNACLFGLNNAHLLRCETNMACLNNKNNSEQEIQIKEIAIAETLSSCQHLTEYFWCPGFIQAGAILLRLGLYLKDLDSDRSQSFIEQAVKNFICATFIENAPQSKKLINEITGNKGLDILLELEGIETFSWEQAKNKMVDLVGNQYDVLENQAKLEIAAFTRLRS